MSTKLTFAALFALATTGVNAEGTLSKWHCHSHFCTVEIENPDKRYHIMIKETTRDSPEEIGARIKECGFPIGSEWVGGEWTVF